MIDIQIQSKYFNKKKILENIEFHIEDKEFISIIGPSGCGKSTFLNILANLEKDFQGGIDIPFDEVSFMFQDDRLLPWLSVKDNLLLISQNKDLEEIKRVLQLVDLEGVLELFPKALSGGMKRRVALVRAFINRPKLILLDEPFISLDFPTSQELKYEFLKLCGEFNPIVVLVTHDISEAILFSNRIFFLSKSPSTIVLEYKNPNNQSFDMKKIDEIKNNLLEKYPNILKGELWKV